MSYRWLNMLSANAIERRQTIVAKQWIISDQTHGGAPSGA
jgi:hypothetical protein